MDDVPWSEAEGAQKQCNRESAMIIGGAMMAMTERPINEIRKAEAAMQELLKAATELRRQIDLACIQNPEDTAELTKAAAALEREVQRIKDYLQSWRQSIQ